jgi:hypothetical protein
MSVQPERADLLASPAGFRSVYLWAGRATVDLQHVKLPDLPVDVEAHEAAHTEASAQTLAAAGLNVVFLSMNWGFPPELERGHWDDFSRAADVYRRAGFHVLGYVQASNCVYAGSYRSRDWYARDPEGRPVPYYHGRRMTCLNHPEWQAEVRQHARRVLDLGGDGIFFDNIWMGATAWVLGGRLGGFAGCACSHCVAAFAADGGTRIPLRLDGGADAARYLDWRAGVVARRLSEWAAAVRERRPGAWVLANNCDVMLRDSAGLLGVDPARVARPQDALLVENVAMARHKPEKGRLIANALPLKALQALVPDRRVLALTYEHGIGIDGRPSGLRLRRALAEAAAVGAAPVLKGSEFLDARGRLTVLTAPDFTPMRDAAGAFLRWLGEHDFLYRDAEPAPAAGIYLDAEGLRTRWADVVPATFAVALALLRSGVPFTFFTPEGLRASSRDTPPVLVPPGVTPPSVPAGLRLVVLPPGIPDIPAAPSPFLQSAFARALADRPLRALARHYFGSARVRRAFDRAGLTARFLESPLFTLPRRSAEVLEALGPSPAPMVVSDRPVLAESWRSRDGVLRLHLVNYDDAVSRVSVPGQPAPTAVYSPDGPVDVDSEHGLHVHVQTYAVLEWTSRTAPR